MASTLSSFAAFIKEFYTKQKIEDLTMGGKPFWSRIKKNTEISGDPWIVPLIRANPQGISTNVGDQQTQSAGAGGNVVGEKFAISMGDYGGSVSIGDKAIMASRNNVGAFLEDKTTEMDGLFESVSNQMAMYLTRNGGGATGRRLSIANTNDITLTDAADAFNFEVGEYIVCSTGDGSSGSDTLKSGSTYITAVDRVNGIISVNSIAGISGNANNDYIFRLGDFAGDVSQTRLMKGVEAFVTSSATPGSLWGVTRTTDVQRLSGCKVASGDLTGKGIEERWQILGAQMAGRFRAMTTSGSYEGYCHPEDWQNLALSLQSRGIRPLNESTASFNYEFLEVLAGGKRIKIFADPYFKKGTGFILRMDDWTLGSYGDTVRVLNGDGLSMLRATSANDYEFRIASYPGVACKAPGYQGRVALS